MITKTAGLSLVLLLIAMPIGAQKEGPGCPFVQVLEPGQFHGEEVKAETGEKWLGLHIAGDKTLLLNYKLTVDTVKDELTDGPDEMTGKKVSVDLPLQPLFLVRAEGIVSEGPAQTIVEGSFEEPLREQQPLKVNFGSAAYKLEIVSPTGEKCDQYGLPKNAKLVLSSVDQSQVLYALEDCGNDPTWYVIWAGDIDGDDKLDLYISLTQHYNVSERKLFLSSQAYGGKLVHEVAEFVVSGC